MSDLFALPSPETAPSKHSLRQVVVLMRADGVPYPEAIHRFQAAYMERILAQHRGHLGKAALEMGIHRNTMTRKLRVVQGQGNRL